MTDTPETIDTSTEAVERMAAAFAGRDGDLPPARVVDATLRALAAERDDYRQRIESMASRMSDAADCYAERDAAIARAEAAERKLETGEAAWLDLRLQMDRAYESRARRESQWRHLVAEMTRRGLLPVLQEIDREWLAQSAAHAETHDV